MNLGERIYKLRVENNMSQDELAQKINVSRQSISKWENNSAVPDLNKIVILSEVFQVTIDELVKGRYIENQRHMEKAAKNDKNEKNWFWIPVLILIVAIALRSIIFVISNEVYPIYLEEDGQAYFTLRMHLNLFFDKCIDFAMLIFYLSNIIRLVKNDVNETKKVVLFNVISILGVFCVATILSICYPQPEMNYHGDFCNLYLNISLYLVISLIVYLIRYLIQRKQKLD